jgi:hypothetical protein
VGRRLGSGVAKVPRIRLAGGSELGAERRTTGPKLPWVCPQLVTSCKSQKSDLALLRRSDDPAFQHILTTTTLCFSHACCLSLPQLLPLITVFIALTFQVLTIPQAVPTKCSGACSCCSTTWGEQSGATYVDMLEHGGSSYICSGARAS